MLGANFIAVDAAAAELAVESVQVEPVLAWDQGKDLIQIGPQLIRRPRFAGMITSDGQAGAEFFPGVLEAGDVGTLPAVERDWNRREPLERCFRVDAKRRVPLFSSRIRGLNTAVVDRHSVVPRN